MALSVLFRASSDSEHEPVDMLNCVSYLKHLQKLFI